MRSINCFVFWFVVTLVASLHSARVETFAGEPTYNGPKAIELKELQAIPTMECIGVTWFCDGDSNADATGALQYRVKGDANWKDAFPLRRVPRRDNPPVAFMGGIGKWPAKMKNYAESQYAKNYLASSILFLKPATTYEVKVTVKDPDGGGAEKVVTVTTRTVPTIPKNGTVIEVNGGGTALNDAVAKAKPGDIFNVHAGSYAKVKITASGTAEKPICIKAAGDGEVVITGNSVLSWKSSGDRGFDIGGSYIIISGISVRNCGRCFYSGGSTHNVAVMHCKMNHFETAMQMGGSNGYYADNTIDDSYGAIGPNPTDPYRNEGHGIFIDAPNGSGNVACYNSISRVADAFRLLTRDADCIGNDAILGMDDAVETDFAGSNVRIIGNRFALTGQNGLSFQPYIGGPAFLVRNIVVIPPGKESAFKVRFESENVILVNNTLTTYESMVLPLRTYARNNIFYRLKDLNGAAVRYDTRCDTFKWIDIDYNASIGLGPNFSKSPQEYFAATGQGQHDRTKLSASDVFVTPLPDLSRYINAAKKYDVPQIYSDPNVGRPHPDMQLKAGSPAIGAGVIVPNLCETPDGKAPDMGALPHGKPLPHWGVRP